MDLHHRHIISLAHMNCPLQSMVQNTSSVLAYVILTSLPQRTFLATDTNMARLAASPQKWLTGREKSDS